MSFYMIHACKQRLWYVKEYLIPSLEAQGIPSRRIATYIDPDVGCLESCMTSFALAYNFENFGCKGMWHLQDDVIICSDFKERTEKNYPGIVCGYCDGYDQNKHHVGEVTPQEMWYSFPCIYIPNEIAVGCSQWYYREAKNNHEYHMWVESKKYDDSFFMIYAQDYCEDIPVLNIQPNLVDHISHLIGGSIINKIRSAPSRAVYFSDENLVEKLKISLDNRINV